MHLSSIFYVAEALGCNLIYFPTLIAHFIKHYFLCIERSFTHASNVYSCGLHNIEKAIFSRVYNIIEHFNTKINTLMLIC